MPIVSTSRYIVHHRDPIIALSRRSRDWHVGQGVGGFEVSIISTGPMVGQWLVRVSHADWPAYARLLEVKATQPDWQALMAEVREHVELLDMTITAVVAL